MYGIVLKCIKKGPYEDHIVVNYICEQYWTPFTWIIGIHHLFEYGWNAISANDVYNTYAFVFPIIYNYLKNYIVALVD
jgi:hypothetical protein